MTKEHFCNILQNIQDYQTEIDKLIDVVGDGILESSLIQRSFDIIQRLIEITSDYDKNTIEDIEWWLYEDVKKVWTIDKKDMDVSTPEKLYNAIIYIKNT